MRGWDSLRLFSPAAYSSLPGWPMPPAARDEDGEAVFRAAALAGPPPPFLFITAHGDIEQAVRLLRAGGADYLTKPFAIDVFLDRLAAVARSPEDIQATGALGVSTAMRMIEDTLSRIAATDLPVLISGETGVGKEIAARLLHARSTRAGEPIIAVKTAPRSPLTCSKASSSAMRRAPSPALSCATPAMPSAARSFSTRSATCLCTCKASCCA